MTASPPHFTLLAVISILRPGLIGPHTHANGAGVAVLSLRSAKHRQKPQAISSHFAAGYRSASAPRQIGASPAWWRNLISDWQSAKPSGSPLPLVRSSVSRSAGPNDQRSSARMGLGELLSNSACTKESKAAAYAFVIVPAGAVRSLLTGGNCNQCRFCKRLNTSPCARC